MQTKYAVKNGRILITKAGSDLAKRKKAFRRETDRLDASFVGSTLAWLFLNLPWVGGIEVVFEATVYRDQDSICTNVSSELKRLDIVGGLGPASGKGAQCVETSVAVAAVYPYLRDAAESLHTVMSGWGGSLAPVELKVPRKLLQPLLEGASAGQAVSGDAVFCLLFPEKAIELGMMPAKQDELATA